MKKMRQIVLPLAILFIGAGSAYATKSKFHCHFLFHRLLPAEIGIVQSCGIKPGLSVIDIGGNDIGVEVLVIPYLVISCRSYTSSDLT